MSETTTLREVIAILKHFNCNGTDLPENYRAQHLTDNVAIVEVASVYWMISDNGGELMVGRINLDTYNTAVPLTWFGENLNASTVASRVASLLRGEKIDYEDRWSDAEEEVIKAA